MSTTGVHRMTAYPLARTVGCSCGWARRDVAPEIMDDLYDQHVRVAS